MWVARNEQWNDRQTSLSKFFFELVKQRVDPTESISNRHRTTNGHTMLSEIVLVSSLVRNNPRFSSRLVSLIEEGRDPSIKSNIVNDIIISNHFDDILKFFKNIQVAHLEKENYFKTFHHEVSVKYERTFKHYFGFLTKELLDIDYGNESQFVRNARLIEPLVDSLIPYLLHIDYSTTTISDLAYRYVSRWGGAQSVKKYLGNFNGKRSEFKFLFKVPRDSVEFEFMREKFNKELIKVKLVYFEKVKEKILQDGFSPDANEDLFEVSVQATDPHNFIRAIYDVGLKRYVAAKERLSLSFFNNFFDNVLWRFSKANDHKYIKSSIYLDPVNTPYRVNTLNRTLVRLAKDYDLDFDKDSELDHISSLFQPVYFYHLALRSKSLENSLSLLWTSLETLLPYRSRKADIENIKTFVSKSLSIGAISRDLMSFAMRLVETNKLHDNKLSNLGTPNFGYKPNNLIDWAEWLTETFNESNDPYLIIKQYSNLLCWQFCSLNDQYSGKINTCGNLLNRVESSARSISYQLDRIYLHRNQIVHSGKFINEYSNLWSNLEWYVGKLISFAVLNHLIGRNNDISNMFLELEGDYEQLTNSLKINKSKKINEVKHLFSIMYEHTWQSF